MTDKRPVVLVLGSGPNVTEARNWPKQWFDRIVVINNAWRVREDWDDLVFPEDFPEAKRPIHVQRGQRLVEADAFVPAQNAYGGFVHAGATMAYTTAYWALSALRPSVLAFMGCDMVYPEAGNTHFYGTGVADPLRDDVTLRDLGAKSARLASIAASQECACVNLSTNRSALLFPRAAPEGLRKRMFQLDLDRAHYAALRAQEDALGYATPDGRYTNDEDSLDMAALARIDAQWRSLFIDRGRDRGC